MPERGVVQYDVPPVSSGMTQTRSGWTPALVGALRHYSWSLFAHDVVAGPPARPVPPPLALAFAIASGLQPEQGIYCAIVTGFLISALGGSKYQIGGPTRAFGGAGARDGATC